jgi:hypothetical protein
MIDTNDRFFVHIIESPADFDLLDGRTEGRVLLEALNLSSVPAAYSLVTTRTTLDEALGNRLIQAADYYKRIPILHLSLHGNSQGIELTENISSLGTISGNSSFRLIRRVKAEIILDSQRSWTGTRRVDLGFCG